MHTLVLELRESIKLLVISMLALTKVVHTRVLLTSMHTWRRTDCQRFSLPSSFSLLSLLPRSLMDGTSCGRLIIIRYFTVNLVRRIYFKHGNSMSLQEPIGGGRSFFTTSWRGCGAPAIPHLMDTLNAENTTSYY